WAAPEGPVETAIAQRWANILKIDNVGRDDNFFDLGGNSLLLVQVHGRLEQVFARPVVMVELFNHPTVRSLAAHLTETAPDDSAPVVETKAEPQRSEQLQEGRDRLKRRLDRRRGG
ncbi:MAG: phosphopantetheine-binding protein, partial [Thermoanaerobaculia bacterium]|nr:phosphopantetheine-binding protein [Thermoanaerobaculia bacterium]